MEKKYHGIIPPIATPVDEHENVDEPAFRALIDYCIAGGLHGIFVAGTNGETMQLTQQERNHAIRICVDQVNGRVPVIAGCMDTSTRRVIENIKAAEDLGAACVAVTPIFYDRHTSQDEITRHFERILQETSCEIMIYNIPPFTGEKIAPKTVTEIAQMDRRVVGYKDSSGAFGEFMQVLSVYRDTPFSVMQGVTPCALPAILMGADGFVPALAPAFPEMFVSAYEAAKSKDCDLAWKYQEVIRESSRILGMTKNATAASKYAISLRGLMDKRVIYPQDTISPEEEAHVRDQVQKVDAMYGELKALSAKA